MGDHECRSMPHQLLHGCHDTGLGIEKPGTGIEVAAGATALREVAARPADWVMSAIVGAAGLKPTLEAVRQGSLVAATQGRGFWVLDDITPLRVKSAEIDAAPVHLYPIQDHTRFGYNWWMDYGGGPPSDGVIWALGRAGRAALIRAGLDPAHIADPPGCTMCLPERFYSYRRDGARIGQQLAYIGLE